MTYFISLDNQVAVEAETEEQGLGQRERTGQEGADRRMRELRQNGYTVDRRRVAPAAAVKQLRVPREPRPQSDRHRTPGGR